MSRKTQLEGRLLSILQRDVARRVFSGRGVAIACALAVAVIVPYSALRLIATPSEETNKPAAIKEEVAQKKSDAEVNVDADADVNDDVSAIGDYLLAKLGKYDKRADRWMREPRNGEDWYERAYDLYRNDRYAEAAAAFHKAADARYREDTSLYNAACSYALLGDADNAMKDLSAAIDAGWDDFDHIADDSDFDPIRTDARFARLLDSKHADLSTRRVREATEKFEELRTEGVTKHNGDDWFDSGLDLLRLRKLDDSIAAFQSSIAANEKVGSSMYNIACAYSYKHDAANGLAWLAKSVENGFSDDDKFATDQDLSWLRNQPGFDAIRDKARDLELHGCCDGPVMSRLWDNWKESEEHHQKMVRKYPDSGRAWFNLGYTALQARDFGTAIDAFGRAISLNYRTGTSSYNIACAYALQKNSDAAFAWLDRAKNAGFDLDDHLEDDDDLNSLHRDARWDALVR
jgi:tetratricopeptide (TPR) repeat protein